MTLGFCLSWALGLIRDVTVMNMKSVIEFAWGVNSKTKQLVLLIALVVSGSGVVRAAEGTITKVVTPPTLFVFSDSNTMRREGLVVFRISNSDFPQGTALDSKRLLDIQWRTTRYSDSINEAVSLCYLRTWSSQEDCREISPSSSGTLSDFNGELFDYFSQVKIYHRVVGGKRPSIRPVGVDSVVFRYRY